MNSLPHRLFSAQAVRELDRCAIEDYGIAGITLMERAGRAAYDLLLQLWPEPGPITVLCGPGNNGGDGFVVARLAHEDGYRVEVKLLSEAERLRGDAAQAFAAVRAAGVPVSTFDADSMVRDGVIVDAMLGTGLDRQVEGLYAQAIQTVNSFLLPVLAIDVPSGLDADRGAVHGISVHASATISFIGLKPGLLTGYGADYCGRVYFNDLHVPEEIYRDVPAVAQRIDYDSESVLLGRRDGAAHKGRFGHVLVIGGDVGMAGAVRMAAEAAARVGAGLVSIATRSGHAALISAVRPELMAHGVETDADFSALCRRATVIAVGPGLGQGDWGQRMFRAALDSRLPLIVDADALNMLAAEPQHRSDWILTPHPGEAGRLLGISTAAVQQDRFAAVMSLQQRYGGVSVLKGAGSLICDAPQSVALCSDGNPGMASGGMGDVLSGVIAGLRAQQLAAAQSARLGVALHARAGDRAAAERPRGLLAGDLMTEIRALANPDSCR